MNKLWPTVVMLLMLPCFALAVDPFYNTHTALPYDVNTVDQVTGYTLENNGAAVTTGIISNAYNFINIQTDYMNYSSLNVANLTDYSVSFWIKTFTLPGNNMIYSLGHATCGGAYFIDNDNFAFIRYWPGNNKYYQYNITNDFTFSDGSWHHVVINWNQTTPELWVDGANKSTNYITELVASCNEEFIIGSERPLANYLNGIVDEFYIFNGTRSPAQISDLYNGGSARRGPYNAGGGLFCAAYDYYDSFDVFPVTFRVYNGSLLINTTTNTTGNQAYFNYSIGTHTVFAAASGYVTESLTDATANFSVFDFYLHPIGTLDVNIFDADTGTKLAQEVNLTVQNATHERSFSPTTGYIRLNLTHNVTHNFIFSTNNYTSVEYQLQMTDQDVINGLNAYMQPNATAVTIRAQDTSANSIEDARVEIYDFVNGTLELISQKFTDALGRVTQNLVLDETYLFNITKQGYESISSQIELTETELTFTMLDESGVELTGPTTGVYTRYLPTNLSLPPTNVTFSWQVAPDDTTVELWGFNITNGSTVILTVSSTSPTGGTVNRTLNLSAYNNSIIYATYFFKKEGFDTVKKPVTYFVRSRVLAAYDADDAREKAKSLHIGTRVVLWILCIVLMMMFFVKMGITAERSAIVSFLLGLVLAYLLAISLYVLGALVGIGILAMAGRKLGVVNV